MPIPKQQYMYVRGGGASQFHLHCNIFIYIRHIWIKPVLCSRMVSLFPHTWPWTHRCLQSLSSAHRNGRVFQAFGSNNCYWILNSGKSTFNWNSQTNAGRLWWSVCWCEYSKTLGKPVQIWRVWASTFWVTKHEVEGPVTASDQLRQDRVEELIRGDFVEK